MDDEIKVGPGQYSPKYNNEMISGLCHRNKISFGVKIPYQKLFLTKELQSQKVGNISPGTKYLPNLKLTTSRIPSYSISKAARFFIKDKIDSGSISYEKPKKSKMLPGGDFGKNPKKTLEVWVKPKVPGPGAYNLEKFELRNSQVRCSKMFNTPRFHELNSSKITPAPGVYSSSINHSLLGNISFQTNKEREIWKISDSVPSPNHYKLKSEFELSNKGIIISKLKRKYREKDILAQIQFFKSKTS